MPQDELDDAGSDRPDDDEAGSSSTEILGRTDLSESAIVETLVTMIGDAPVGEPAIAPENDRERAWARLLAELARLDRHQTYVGSFGVAVRAAAGHVKDLSASDRRVAAAVILDRTVGTAESAVHLREAISAVSSLSPDVVAPQRVIDSVLRPALRHSHKEGGQARVAIALRTTLEIVASSPTPSISYQDMWAVRAAIPSTGEDLDELRTLVERLPPVDRDRVLTLLPSTRRRRRRRDR